LLKIFINGYFFKGLFTIFGAIFAFSTLLSTTRFIGVFFKLIQQHDWDAISHYIHGQGHDGSGGSGSSGSSGSSAGSGGSPPRAE